MSMPAPESRPKAERRIDRRDSITAATATVGNSKSGPSDTMASAAQRPTAAQAQNQAQPVRCWLADLGSALIAARVLARLSRRDGTASHCLRGRDEGLRSSG